MLFGVLVTRVRGRRGSHMRVTSTAKGREHHVTIPAHKQLKVGTLGQILADVASYLGLTREEIAQRLFG